MNVKRIASFLLVACLAIFVISLFHTHLVEQTRDHCNICQVLSVGGSVPLVVAHAPVLLVERTHLRIIRVAAITLPIFSESERAPPTL
jgi:hypothetical protein